MFAEALAARETLLANPGQTVEQMARELGMCRIRLSRLVRISFTAPDAIDAAMNDEQLATA